MKDDVIRRQAVFDEISKLRRSQQMLDDTQRADLVMHGLYLVEKVVEKLPSVQLDRDIPMKPNETTDRSWGIPKKQAVCPKCDYYLGHVSFLGDYKGKRITYCETCGQAIDWEGWDFDE